MAHPRRRYAGAVALAGTFAACLAAPHPLRGDSGTGGGVDDGGRTGTDGGISGCMPIDLTAASCSAGTGIGIGGGAVIMSGSGGPILTCTWTFGAGGIGTATSVEVFMLTASGSSTFSSLATFAMGVNGTDQTLGLYQVPQSQAGHPQLVFNGTGGQTVVTPTWLRFAASTAGMIVEQFSPDGNTWTTVNTITGTAASPTQVKLELTTSGGSGMGSATFEQLERCP